MPRRPSNLLDSRLNARASRSICPPFGVVKSNLASNERDDLIQGDKLNVGPIARFDLNHTVL